MKVLDIQPEPVLISDSKSRSLSIFGGIQPLITQFDFSNPIANQELTKEIKIFLDELSPLLDDAYRIDVSAYSQEDKLITDIQPLRKKIRRSPSSSADWKFDRELMHNFRSLHNIILQSYLEGRHTAFGLHAETKRLFFVHMLQKDARKVHEFLGNLQLKILEIFFKTGHIHYFNSQDSLIISLLLDGQGNINGFDDSSGNYFQYY